LSPAGSPKGLHFCQSAAIDGYRIVDYALRSAAGVPTGDLKTLTRAFFDYQTGCILYTSNHQSGEPSGRRYATQLQDCLYIANDLSEAAVALVHEIQGKNRPAERATALKDFADARRRWPKCFPGQTPPPKI